MQYTETTVAALLMAADRQAWRYKLYEYNHHLRMVYNDINLARLYLN